ncbi:MAG: ribbon-helix-helix domain-containing protein [Actinobacteria bacterium]|nr:ribbon-helix-helix domain-containing protein [Actinomycetota bacterium]
MRTTITLDADVARAVEEARRERGVGVSEIVNALARRGLARSEAEPRPFHQNVSAMGRPRLPLDDIEETLAILEGDAHG